MVRVNDRRGENKASPLEVAEQIASYSRQQALIDEAHRFASDHGWAVHREPRGTPLTSLIMVRTDPTPRLVFLECVPSEVTDDWRTWLEVPAMLEEVAEKSGTSVQVLIATPSDWQLVVDALS